MLLKWSVMLLVFPYAYVLCLISLLKTTFTVQLVYFLITQSIRFTNIYDRALELFIVLYCIVWSIKRWQFYCHNNFHQIDLLSTYSRLRVYEILRILAVR